MAEKDKTMSTEEAVDKIWDLAKSIDICMLVTWDGTSSAGAPALCSAQS